MVSRLVVLECVVVSLCHLVYSFHFILSFRHLVASYRCKQVLVGATYVIVVVFISVYYHVLAVGVLLVSSKKDILFSRKLQGASKEDFSL